ncbi:DDT domain protein [Medicago truncatula]|uniref:DDT domain protein n=1 Tax=Medicago truncatula TaxID=3880 RepID=G7JM67_MEDTR|nr:DDT domain protein [Medicago truncatula]
MGILRIKRVVKFVRYLSVTMILMGSVKSGKDEYVVYVTNSSELNGENDNDQDNENDVDLSSGSVSNVETMHLPPSLHLSPSSETIGVPEPSVSHLLSVYGFLRSFNTRLFLHPFTLDEFVGALNYQGPELCLMQYIFL